MRFDYNLPKIMKNLWNSIWIKFKPLTVHLEAIMVDEVWEEIKKKSLNNEVLKWYVMTPANYDYFRSSFKIKRSKEEVSKLMVERYKWMLEHGQRLELHIHLSITRDMNYNEQEKLFKEALAWLREELKLDPKEFVPGWWAYNQETLKVLKKLGLKMVKFSDYNSTHDYHWILDKKR